MNDASPVENPPPFDDAKMQLLLAQLKQLEASEGISWWPLAPGWWILIIIIAITLVVAIKQLLKYRHIKKQQALLLEQYKRIADSYRSQQPSNQSSSHQYLSHLNQLLRRAVMLHLPRQQIANCQGKQWLTILRLTPVVINDDITFALLNACYQPNPSIDFDNLNHFAEQWFTQQHPNIYKANAYNKQETSRA